MRLVLALPADVEAALRRFATSEDVTIETAASIALTEWLIAQGLALNDPDMRRLIDSIDDLWASLYHGERREPVLEGLLASEVSLLRVRGFDYDPRIS